MPTAKILSTPSCNGPPTPRRASNRWRRDSTCGRRQSGYSLWPPRAISFLASATLRTTGKACRRRSAPQELRPSCLLPTDRTGISSLTIRRRWQIASAMLTKTTTTCDGLDQNLRLLNFPRLRRLNVDRGYDDAFEPSRSAPTRRGWSPKAKLSIYSTSVWSSRRLISISSNGSTSA